MARHRPLYFNTISLWVQFVINIMLRTHSYRLCLKLCGSDVHPSINTTHHCKSSSFEIPRLFCIHVCDLSTCKQSCSNQHGGRGVRGRGVRGREERMGEKREGKGKKGGREREEKVCEEREVGEGRGGRGEERGHHTIKTAGVVMLPRRWCHAWWSVQCALIVCRCLIGS